MLSNIAKNSNDVITSFDHLSGAGMVFRDSTRNPPQVRQQLIKHGDEIVTSLQLVRTPLSDATRFLLNIASFGQLEEKLKQSNIDQLFHLSLFINNRYTFEKNEVIKFTEANPASKKSETLIVPVYQDDLSIGAMVKNTMAKMGGEYGSYDALSNNCQVFVGNVLSSNALDNPTTTKFLHQDIPELYEKFPSLTKYLTKFATSTGAVVDRQIQGEGRGY